MASNKPKSTPKKNPPKNWWTGNNMPTRTEKRHVSRGGTYGNKGEKGPKYLSTSSILGKGDWEAKVERESRSKSGAKKDIAAGRTSTHSKTKKVPIPRKNPKR